MGDNCDVKKSAKMNVKFLALQSLTWIFDSMFYSVCSSQSNEQWSQSDLDPSESQFEELGSIDCNFQTANDRHFSNDFLRNSDRSFDPIANTANEYDIFFFIRSFLFKLS